MFVFQALVLVRVLAHTVAVQGTSGVDVPVELQRAIIKDAYMLVYVRQDLPTTDVGLPPSLTSLVESHNRELERAADLIASSNQSRQQAFEEEVKERAAVFEALCPGAGDDDYRWISWQWLKDWAMKKTTGSQSSGPQAPSIGPIDNAMICCGHSGTSVGSSSKLALAGHARRRLISVRAYEILHKR